MRQAARAAQHRADVLAMTKTLAWVALPLWYAALIGAVLVLALVCLAADWAGISDELDEELTEY